jgi:hypothetical protein
LQKEKRDNLKEIETLNEEIMNATSNKEYVRIDGDIRGLETRNEEILDELKRINADLNRMEKEDEEYNAYLQEVADAEEAKFMAKNMEKIANLDADKEALALAREVAADTKALFDEYNVAEADRPADWTQEFQDDLEIAFFDAQALALEAQ